MVYNPDVEIIIDSTTDAIAAVRSRCTVVPLSVRFADTEYIDGIAIDHVAFYEKLMESKELPTTSQPTPDPSPKPMRIGSVPSVVPLAPMSAPAPTPQPAF